MEERIVNSENSENSNDWYGQSVQVNSDPLIDSGKGKQISIRTFEFSTNPELKVIPSRQEVFNAHWPQIKNQLWKDGLTALEEVEPRFKFSDDKKKYFIIVVCQAQANTVFLETSKTLQELLPKPI